MKFRIHEYNTGPYKYTLATYYNLDTKWYVELKQWCAATYGSNWKYVQGYDQLVIYLKSDADLNIFQLRWADS